MKTLASMSEIVRVGGWALRGAGFPFGVAERGTRLLAYTEAVHGGAVRDVYAHEPIITRVAALKDVAHARRADGGWSVDGGGRHLLEIGPPLTDLATSDARLCGLGHARLSHVAGFIFITALADLLVHRRLTGVCVYRASAKENLPQSVARSGWILFGRRGDEPVFATGVAGDPLAQRILTIASGTSFGSAVPDDLAQVSSPGEGYLAVTACGAEHAAGAEFLALLDRPEAKVALRDYPTRLSDAYRNGVTMEPKDLQDLYDLEIRTWAPTSERSRSQAGYGKF
jgi:hypothetical protein